MKKALNKQKLLMTKKTHQQQQLTPHKQLLDHSRFYV